MSKSDLLRQIGSLKSKQEVAQKNWVKAGNRDLLQFLVEIMPMALRAERCSIFILDPKEQKVWIECGTGLGEREVVVPKNTSLVGRAISEGKSFIENDMITSAGEHEVVAVRTGFVAHDTACVPIVNARTKEVIGAIQMLNKWSGDKWSDEDLVVLGKMASIIERNIADLFLRQEMDKISIDMGKKIKELENQLFNDIAKN